MKEVFISLPLRTPIGKFGGSLKDIPAPKLAAEVIKKFLRKPKSLTNRLNDVVIGNVVLAGEK